MYSVKGFVSVFLKFPLLAWAAWQLQFCPAACGTLRGMLQNLFLNLPPLTVQGFTKRHLGALNNKSAQSKDV